MAALVNDRLELADSIHETCDRLGICRLSGNKPTPAQRGKVTLGPRDFARGFGDEQKARVREMRPFVEMQFIAPRKKSGTVFYFRLVPDNRVPILFVHDGIRWQYLNRLESVPVNSLVVGSIHCEQFWQLDTIGYGQIGIFTDDHIVFDSKQRQAMFQSRRFQSTYHKASIKTFFVTST